MPLDWQWKGREERSDLREPDDLRLHPGALDRRGGDRRRRNRRTTASSATPARCRASVTDDLAALVNRSLEEQGADMLVRASVKDLASGRQQMVIKSHVKRRTKNVHSFR